MSTGSLLFPVGHIFLDDNGAPVAAGKLYAYRTGTTTAQDTYSDSTLSTPNANPVTLNSSGRATTAIYGDPSSGYDYRLRLSTSADVQIWQYDDIVVDGADTATLVEGSFTGTLTGYASGPTGTVYYRIVANSAGAGKICTLFLGADILGTSNANSLTMTGLPVDVRPSRAVRAPCFVRDNSVGDYIGAATIDASGSTITFAISSPLNGGGFSASNQKGLRENWQITYPL